MSLARYQMQALGLIGAFPAHGTGGADVSRQDEPDAAQNHVRALKQPIANHIEEGFPGSLFGHVQQEAF